MDCLVGYAACVFKKLSPVLVVIAATAGCGGNPGPANGGEPTPAQKSARMALVKANPALNDLELAHLCPRLYPTDLLAKDPKTGQLKNLKKYGFDKQTASAKFTRAQLSAAAGAACGTPIPINIAPKTTGSPPTTKSK